MSTFRFRYLIPLLMPACASGEGAVFSNIDLHASSEPVSISNMISGWDDGFQSGRYAYADGRITFGARFSDWEISHEQRWYYYMAFSRDTSVYYHNMEQGLSSGDELNLALDVKSFEAAGIRLAKFWQINDWTFKPSLAVYRVTDYQFGELNGVSSDGSGSSASATLDYHFSEDKILDYSVDVPAGQGYSLDFTLGYGGFQDWQLQLKLADALNYWVLPEAGYTTGCINLGNSAGTVCSSSGSASGRSGQDKYTTSIPLTIASTALYEPLSLRFDLYRHDRYQRLSLQKDWQTAVGELGVSVHTTHQIGLHWLGEYHHISLVTDDRRLHYARDLQMNVGLRWQW